ncbi:Uncharacterized protein GBIM_17789 [Gryllus bimaculatus]|nr:Uncharacterized protein GBIM_17789 [Gryllus bimaculatus]
MASYNPSGGMDGASGTEVAVALVNVVQRMIAEAARLQVQEALRLQEQEAERRLQEAVELQEHDYAARARQIEPVEETMRPSSARRESKGAAEQRAMENARDCFPARGGSREAGRPFPPRPPPPLLPPRFSRPPPGAPWEHDEDRPRQQLWRRLNELETRRRASRSSPSDLGEDLCNATCADEVRYLLDSGADVNYTNTRGKCPLISAIDLITDDQSGDDASEMVSLLLARGADANSIDMDGSSALHLVSGGENFDLLIEAGADVDARNWEGATPLHIAVDWNDEVAVRSLSLRAWKAG